VIASLAASARSHAQQGELEGQLDAVEERLREMDHAARHSMHYRSAADLRAVNTDNQ
jgi:hypothetical protein